MKQSLSDAIQTYFEGRLVTGFALVVCTHSTDDEGSDVYSYPVVWPPHQQPHVTLGLVSVLAASADEAILNSFDDGT